MWVGNTSSFEISFIASLTGTISPMREGLLGPLRIWEYLRSLRSVRVRKAIETILHTHRDEVEGKDDIMWHEAIGRCRAETEELIISNKVFV